MGLYLMMQMLGIPGKRGVMGVYMAKEIKFSKKHQTLDTGFCKVPNLSKSYPGPYVMEVK